MLTQGAVAAAVLAAAVSTAPENNTTTAIPTPVSGDACATISASLQADPEATLFPASVGYACLKAVPVDAEGDGQLVKEIQGILQWQSTLAYLKDPPQGYPNPSVDILSGLDDISTKLSEGGYTSEYDVQNDIRVLLKKAYDGHTYYLSDIASIINFGKFDEYANPVELVSLSSDGVSLPKVYVLNDIIMAQFASNFTPSAVNTINNQSTVDYLNWLADQNYNSHDVDGRYQSIFWDPALQSYQGVGSGFFQNPFTYEGDSTIFGFENGTTATITHVSGTKANFTGVDSGEAFFEKFCTGPTSTSDDPEESSTPTPDPLPTAYGYPYPVAKTDDNSVSGYFLNDTGYQDVAVISTANFLAANISQYQSVVSDVLAEAVAQKKKHLIVDLRRNGGGSVILGFDLFKQLFPSIDPWGASRIRATPAYGAIGDVITAIANEYDLANNATAMETLSASIQSTSIDDFWARTAGVDANGNPFASWASLFGPHALAGDNFTSLIRNNFADPLVYSGNFSVSGYLARAALPPQPFAAENIVLLQDGYCASTCAVFAELMKSQGGVRSVVVGGRPQAGPMVAVGGTKGAQTLSFDVIVAAANDSRNLAESDEQLALLESAGVVSLADSETALGRTAVGPEGLQGSINYRNNYRKGDATDTPLQFVKDYADCRVFYTAPMMFDPVPLWNTVYDSMWRNGSCVAGSTGYGNSTINGTRTTSGSGATPSVYSSAAVSGGVAQVGVAALVSLVTMMVVM